MTIALNKQLKNAYKPIGRQTTVDKRCQQNYEKQMVVIKEVTFKGKNEKPEKAIESYRCCNLCTVTKSTYRFEAKFPSEGGIEKWS